MLAQRLLREFLWHTFAKQLVEAYIIGYPTHENQFQFLKVSESAGDVGGYISYCTFGQDTKIADIMPNYLDCCGKSIKLDNRQGVCCRSENKGSLSNKSNEIIHIMVGAKKCKWLVRN